MPNPNSSNVIDLFSDVNTGDWFLDYVQYAYDKGIMKGVGNYRFAPNEPLTRAQIAQILEARETTVRTNLRRGRLQLKEILKQEYDFAEV